MVEVLRHPLNLFSMSSEDVFKYNASKVSIPIGNIVGSSDTTVTIDHTLSKWEYGNLMPQHHQYKDGSSRSPSSHPLNIGDIK